MKLTKMRGKFLRRHGGTILAVVASVGVVATAIDVRVRSYGQILERLVASCDDQVFQIDRSVKFLLMNF